MPVQAVGVDGCRPGWIAAVDHGATTTLERFLDNDPEALFAAFPKSVIVIDVPIGLVDRGPRGADVAARLFVGARRGSVFTAPIRSMLEADDWTEACRIRYEVEGKRCSKQAAAIIPKVRAVDRRMSSRLQVHVREGHPEVSFGAMAGTRGLTHHKRGVQGRRERLDLLSPHFADVGQVVMSQPAGLRGDAVDAYAMLWTARRIVAGKADALPREEVPQDGRGLRCEIVY